PFPGPLDGWLAVPCARSPVHVPLDVAELEVPGAIALELDERLDFSVEVVLVPLVHRSDMPQALEGLLFLGLLRHGSLRAWLPIRRDVRDQPLVSTAHGKAVVQGSHPLSSNAL